MCVCVTSVICVQDPTGTVRRLAEFLGVPTSPELCVQIAEACSFQNMKIADDTKQTPEWFEKIPMPKVKFYRKGRTLIQNPFFFFSPLSPRIFPSLIFLLF